MRPPPVFSLVLLLGAASVALATTEKVLFDAGLEATHITASDARFELESSPQPRLTVSTGTEKPWPGVTLRAPTGHWDLSAFGHVEARLYNPGPDPVTVSCRIDNPDANGIDHCVTGSVRLNAGQHRSLQVRLKRTSEDTLEGRLFGLRGYPVSSNGPRTVDPSRVTQILLFVAKPSHPHRFILKDLRAAGSWTAPTAWTSDADPYFPLIDAFGQYRHKDWPGKTQSPDDLRQRRLAETDQLANDTGPAHWNQYGGWKAGPRLESTGFFRTAKVRDKWWLVDPEGRLFWSHGIDCVRMLDSTVVEDREHWFEDFPGAQRDFSEFVIPHVRILKGHYAGRSPRAFSFAGANLKRKYGRDWRQAVSTRIHERLRHWGLNTIGNWSDEGVRLMRQTPYTDNLHSRRTPDIEGSEGYWGKFPDVFHPTFRASLLRDLESKRGKSVGDPWCIGFFSDNELAWGSDISLAVATLQSPARQAAKEAFMADLKARYGDIEVLNQTWHTKHGSWQALLENQDPPPIQTARPDLERFYTLIAETYFRTVRDVVQQVAPGQLYLGCRFAWVNQRAATAAAKYCDVVSYNLYRRSVADFVFNGGADVPLLIGEFHFGALDRGLFHTGLVPVDDQSARAEAYRNYVEGALHHSQFVGCHWFQYQDEPTTGRVLDEENYQIGFVDIADTPYSETTAASRDVGHRLYRERW